MSTGIEAFSPLIYLDAAKFVMLRVFVVIETTYPKILAKPGRIFAKSTLPVDVCCSQTSVLKLPIDCLTSCFRTFFFYRCW